MNQFTHQTTAIRHHRLGARRAPPSILVFVVRLEPANGKHMIGWIELHWCSGKLNGDQRTFDLEFSVQLAYVTRFP